MEINVEYLCENTDLLRHLEIDIMDCTEEEYKLFMQIQDKLVIKPDEYARHTNIDI